VAVALAVCMPAWPSTTARSVWISDTLGRTSQPADSIMQETKDRFFAHLAIEDEL